MIHTSSSKSKKRKPTAKQRELRDDWEKLLNKYKTKPVKASSSVLATPKPYIRETQKIPSRGNGIGVAVKQPDKVYTGNMIVGIGTMHKSNAVPVFNDQHAVEISKMRRG